MGGDPLAIQLPRPWIEHGAGNSALRISDEGEPGVILAGDMLRDRILSRYAALRARHAAVLEGRDPILIERGRGPLPRYSVRIGAETRAAANELCGRIHKNGGDCAVLRNPRS